MSARFRNTYDLGIGELGRPEWHQHANCRGMGTELFFGARVDADVLKVCDGCPVMVECGATGQHELFGVWAGRPVAISRRKGATRSRAYRTNACAGSGRLARHESEPAPASTGPARDQEVSPDV